MSALLEKILSRDNMVEALKRVKANKGAGGIDGISVEEIDQYLRENWVNIRDRIRRRTKWIEKKLGLKVNATKSKVTKPMKLKYLGFGFWKDSTSEDRGTSSDKNENCGMETMEDKRETHMGAS